MNIDSRPVYKKLYRAIFPDDLHSHLKRDLKDCQSVLDLGCGPNSLIKNYTIPFKVGVELFEPYLEETIKKGIHNEYIKEDITKVNFPQKSFDAVIMIDVLEHLNKEDGHALLKKIEGWVKKRIIIFTPNGYIWQGDEDHYCHTSSNKLQEHKSGWTAKEFKKLGFKVEGMNGWKPLRGHFASIKYRPTPFWTIVSDLTQEITYYLPQFAFHLYAVKELN